MEKYRPPHLRKPNLSGNSNSVSILSRTSDGAGPLPLHELSPSRYSIPDTVHNVDVILRPYSPVSSYFSDTDASDDPETRSQSSSRDSGTEDNDETASPATNALVTNDTQTALEQDILVVVDGRLLNTLKSTKTSPAWKRTGKFTKKRIISKLPKHKFSGTV
jgi:hypothetical protein